MPKDLKEKLNEKAVTPTKGKRPEMAIREYLERQKSEIQRALPKHLDAERLTRIAMTTIRLNPQLQQCTVASLLGAVMQAAQLGLEPGLLGHCYLIPFKNNKKGTHEVQFMIGYKGMIDLARRSGNIQSIYAHEVRENDEFEYEYGLQPKLVHKPAMSDRGKVIGYYAVAHFKDGGYQFEFMPMEKVEERRQRSAAAKSGPWVTDFDEMAKKTVIRYMFKYLPVSVEIQQSIAHDETVKASPEDEPHHPDQEDYIDIGDPPPVEDGDVDLGVG